MQFISAIFTKSVHSKNSFSKKFKMCYWQTVHTILDIPLCFTIGRHYTLLYICVVPGERCILKVVNTVLTYLGNLKLFNFLNLQYGAKGAGRTIFRL